MLDEYCLKDPLFEGFILRDFRGNRYKLKNKFYIQINKLKYRGWKSATPNIIVPLLKNHEDKLDLIYEVLSHNRTAFDMVEYRKRFTYCQKNTKLTKVDPFLDGDHSKKYCLNIIEPSISGLAKIHPYYDVNGMLNVIVELRCI